MLGCVQVDIENSENAHLPRMKNGNWFLANIAEIVIIAIFRNNNWIIRRRYCVDGCYSWHARAGRDDKVQFCRQPRIGITTDRRDEIVLPRAIVVENGGGEGLGVPTDGNHKSANAAENDYRLERITRYIQNENANKESVAANPVYVSARVQDARG